MLLGTIAYLAPELVTKGAADVRSDVYSAGIMMYELLVGEQPYRGDEPVNIAYRHANDNVPAPSERQHDVPRELDDLVVWATERDPEDRPADAGGMLAALRQAERDIATHGGTPVPPGSASLPTHDDPSTKMLAVADADEDAWGHLTMPTDPRGLHELADELPSAPLQDSRPTHVPPPGGFALNRSPALPPNAARLAKVNRQKRRSGVVAALVVALLVVAAAGIGWWNGIGPGSYDAPPQLVGLSQTEAESAIVDAGFTVGDITSENSLEVPEGEVMSMDPPSGLPLAPDSPISLVVSAGPRILTVPALAGLPREDAIAAIEQAGFSYEEDTDRREFSSSVEEGSVLYATSATGEALPQELTETEPIRLVISEGPVPVVEGEYDSDAIAILDDAGLVGVVIAEQYSKTVPEGVVISQETTTDPVLPGDEIHLVTSLGPDLVEVPNVAGKTLPEAIATLEAAGFTVKHEVPSILVDKAVVSQMSPAAGERVDRGSQITLRATYQF